MTRCSMLLAALLVLSMQACDGPSDREIGGQLGSPPWKASGRYEHLPIRESSGFAASRQFIDVYWTLNDSGNAPVLYATKLDGTLIREFPVRDTRNTDWEALAVDDQRQIWIGEIGNNSRERDDLAVLVLAEPDPSVDTHATVTARYPYRYPDKNVDAEGMFVWQGFPYIVSKERERAVLYRFGALMEGEKQELQEVGTLRDARVITGAELSQDGTRLAVTTYGQVWVYDGAGDIEEMIGHEPSTIKHEFSPEAIGFVGQDLVLTSEDRSIYRLPHWWIERVLPLPPANTVSALSLLGKVDAYAAHVQAMPYREAEIEMDGGIVWVEAEGPDATVSFPLRVEWADRYEIGLVLVHGPGYSQIQPLLDGRPFGALHDAHASELTPGVLATLGTVTLSAREHQLGFRLVSNTGMNRGYQFAIDSYRVRTASEFASEYLILGPFEKPDLLSLDTPLPPEKDRDLKGKFDGQDDKKIRWKSATAESNGFLDLGKAFGSAETTAVAYARTLIHSAQQRKAVLFVGSDDQVAVWVNGREVHRNDVTRGASPDTDLLKCELRSGWNEVFCKIGQNGGGWGLYLRANDPDGSLQYARKQPE